MCFKFTLLYNRGVIVVYIKRIENFRYKKMNTKFIKIFLALTIFLGSSCYIDASEVMFNNSSNKSFSNDDSKVVYKKNENGTLLIPENAKELIGLGSGPFIRLKNGQIFTVTGGKNASLSNDDGKTWTHHQILDKKANDISSPVFIETKDGIIVLAYVNLEEKFWDWDKDILDAPNAVLPTYTIRSFDGGKTWQDNQKLHDDWTGMIRSIIETREGNVVFTTMKLKHNPGSHVVLTYTSGDNGATWKQSNILACDTCSGDHSGLMESTIVQLNNGKLWQLIRTNWGYFEESFSSDQGITWSNPQKTDIDASTAPAALTRLASGRLILVWNREYPEGKSSYPLIGGKENPNLSEAPTSWQREELSMAFSDDDGKNWTSPVVVAKVYKDDSYVFEQWNIRRWLSYPQVFEVSPGKIWVTSDFGGVRLEVNEKDFIKPLVEKGYKPTADTKILLKDGVEELRDVKGAGPYIRLNNNKIFTIQGNQALLSNDNGKSWTQFPILDKEKYHISSPVYVESKTGTIIVAFSNMKEKIWDWDKNINDSPNAKLPTYTIRSKDGGKTWINLQKQHDEWTGALRQMIETKKGNIVFTTMMLKHNPGRHTVLTYTSKNDGKKWKRSNILDQGGTGDHSGLMESTIIQLNNGNIWQLIRTNWGYLYESFSKNEGKKWSEPIKTNIDASTSPPALLRLKSGRLVLVWNRIYPEGETAETYKLNDVNLNVSDVPTSWQRDELAVMSSLDDGKSWSEPIVIAKMNKNSDFVHTHWSSGQLSYPHIFEIHPGEIWITTEAGSLRSKINEDFLDTVNNTMNH